MFSYHNGFHPYKSSQGHQHHRIVSEPRAGASTSFVPIQNGRSTSAGSVTDHAHTGAPFYPYGEDMYGMTMEDADHQPMDFYPTRNSDNTASVDHHFEDAADHLLGLLQREANDYSVPLPVRYYPTEFEETESAAAGTNGNGSDDGKKSKSTSIGPWRKRIASWMYDVVDHFKYDRNVVNIALRYIDQYVSHLLLTRSKSSAGEPAVKRRHFQLIAVTSLYLAIKIHGELQEEPEKGNENAYDFVLSLLAEVDGFGFKGYPSQSAAEDEEDSNAESDDEIRALSNKIKDLRRRHRLGRLHRLADSKNADNSKNSNKNNHPAPLHPIPFKPRKRGMLSGPLRLNSFVELSRGLFTFRDITDTEVKILKALNYVVNPPTSRRFVGELVRILGFCCNYIAGEGNVNVSLGDGAHLALKVGVDRREIISSVFDSACHQIEGAASVPALSLGCLPSVVAYAAMLNAIEDVFTKQLLRIVRKRDNGIDEEDMMIMDEDEKRVGSYDLEDYQRHYRRYSRSQSAPSPHQHSMALVTTSKEHYLEAWKEKFAIAVFQASNCFLAPDSEDILCVRELLMKEVSPLTTEDDSDSNIANADGRKTSTSTSSPASKKRSPRSPRSVVGMTSVRFSGSSSFFSRSNSSSSNVLQSPYDSRRTSLNNARGLSESQLSLSNSKRPYLKQVSAPLASEHHHNGTFLNNMSQFPARASTPEVPQWRYHEGGKATSEAGFDCWSSEAFQPPPFFSA